MKLINEVYAEAEAGMWKPNSIRTSVGEIRKLIKSNQLMLARLNGKIIGSVVVEKEAINSIGKFGMLVVDPRQRGKRFGAQLI